MHCGTSCCARFPSGRTATSSFDALVQRYNGDLANGYGNLVSRVVNMVHKYFGGVVPEAGAETHAEAALREHAEKAIAEFGPAFDELNFSDALKSLWLLVAETDGYLTANAPWKKPPIAPTRIIPRCRRACWRRRPRPSASSRRWSYPILPDAAAKVWQQLGQGEIADAAKQSFLTQSRVGRIEGRNEVWRTRAALSARGKGRSRTYAELSKKRTTSQ